MQHMEQVNLRRYQVTSVDDALAVLEDNGDLSSFDSSGGSRGTASLERGLSYTTKGGQALQLSQKGKKDNLTFTLSVCIGSQLVCVRDPRARVYVTGRWHQ